MPAVYPRWRGEHEFGITLKGNPIGLSPLARGTLLIQQVEIVSVRFIPAGAGNTREQLISDAGLPVYPRWRGEHTPARSYFLPLSGLSPLARGTL